MMYPVLSWLLQYPQAGLLDQAADVASATAANPESYSAADSAPEAAVAEDVRQFLAWARSRPLGDLQAFYTDTFDFSGEHSLHLTYHLLGDLRDRGQALASLKLRYREAGYTLEGSELPDYLPLMLEFAAEAPEPGVALLQAFRAPIEALHRRLVQAENPYALLFRALSRWLPAPSPEVQAQAERILSAKPPDETSGLDLEAAAVGPSSGRSVAPC